MVASGRYIHMTWGEEDRGAGYGGGAGVRCRYVGSRDEGGGGVRVKTRW